MTVSSAAQPMAALQACLTRREVQAEEEQPDAVLLNYIRLQAAQQMPPGSTSVYNESMAQHSIARITSTLRRVCLSVLISNSRAVFSASQASSLLCSAAPELEKVPAKATSHTNNLALHEYWHQVDRGRSSAHQMPSRQAPSGLPGVDLSLTLLMSSSSAFDARLPFMLSLRWLELLLALLLLPLATVVIPSLQRRHLQCGSFQLGVPT